MVKEIQFEAGDCGQVAGLLDDFLSDELAQQVNRQVANHIASCPVCREERERRDRLRESLRKSWNGLQAPAALAEQVRAVLGDEEFTEPAASPTLSWWKMAAAVLLAVVGLSVVFLIQSRHGVERGAGQVVDHYAAVIEDHLNCTGHPADPDTLPLDPEYPRLRQALDRLPEGYVLVGVMECQVRDASFIHYLFRGDGGVLLSLMLEPRELGQSLAVRGVEDRLQGVRILSFSEGELALAGLEIPGFFVYLIGDHFDQERVVQVAEDLFPALSETVGLEG